MAANYGYGAPSSSIDYGYGYEAPTSSVDYGYGYVAPSSVDYGYGYETSSSIDYGYGYGVSPTPSNTPAYPIWTPSPSPSPPACPHGEIIKPIEGLPQCLQSIVFECLASSKCNTCDFACICEELKHLNIGAKISDKCSPADKEAYSSFQGDVCKGPVPPPVKPSSVIVVMTTPAPPPPPPAKNSTVTFITSAANATTTVPVQITTTQTIVSTDKQGKPTTVQSVLVVPASSTKPVAPPAYTGAAASMKMGALAGAVGFMGLVFAGL